MKYVILFVSFLIHSVYSQAKIFDCEINFNWVKTTIEENDAGYEIVIKNKGIDAYKKHNQLYLNHIKDVKTKSECTKTIKNWLGFFRNGHLFIQELDKEDSKKDTIITNSNVYEKYKNWEKIQFNYVDFKKYLNSKNTNEIEGIWVNPPYTIGIKKIGNEFIGFIIEADGIYWAKGQVKLRIDINKQNAVFYMRDHSAVKSNDIELVNQNYLNIGSVFFERKGKKPNTSSNIADYKRSLKATEPYLQKLSKTTLLLRIPDFSYSQKSLIDKVINDNLKLIKQTSNLIIDIRNNGGGSDSSYHQLLPLLYTNAIRVIGQKMFSTELNNKRMFGFINNPDLTDDDRKWAKRGYALLQKNIGKFVNLDDKVVDIIQFKEVNKYPKNIGILINKGVASTSEQFLLAAKQSKKVKLFGHTTMGSLDIANVNFVESPKNDYALGYGLSKSIRIPNHQIDDKGIQPDFYIDKSIPTYKWVEFVKNILDN